MAGHPGVRPISRHSLTKTRTARAARTARPRGVRGSSGNVGGVHAAWGPPPGRNLMPDVLPQRPPADTVSALDCARYGRRGLTNTAIFVGPSIKNPPVRNVVGTKTRANLLQSTGNSRSSSGRGVMGVPRKKKHTNVLLLKTTRSPAVSARQKVPLGWICEFAAQKQHLAVID